MLQSEQTYASSLQVTDVSEHAPLANEDAVILGTNVERLRLAAGFTMSAFAAHANISRPFLYKVERGLSNPRLSDIQKLARALHVETVELLTPPEEKK